MSNVNLDENVHDPIENENGNDNMNDIRFQCKQSGYNVMKMNGSTMTER